MEGSEESFTDDEVDDDPVGSIETTVAGEEPGAGTGDADPKPENFLDDDVGGSLAPWTKTIAEIREDVRGKLAKRLLYLLGLVILGGGLVAAAGWLTVDETKSMLEVLLPPLIALTGTAIGFYFGGISEEKKDGVTAVPAKKGNLVTNALKNRREHRNGVKRKPPGQAPKKPAGQAPKKPPGQAPRKPPGQAR